MTQPEKKKMVEKLRRQFRHQPANVTEDLMKRAEVLTPDLKMINSEVLQNCTVCKRYEKTPPKPIVACPMASKFNGTVVMDYFHVKNLFIHFIDLFT